MEKTKGTWGGRRTGSGRKATSPEEKRVQICITISQETKEILKDKSQEAGVTIGRYIETMVKQ